MKISQSEKTLNYTPLELSDSIKCKFRQSFKYHIETDLCLTCRNIILKNIPNPIRLAMAI